MKEYLLYIDILGYENLAKQIVDKTGHKYEDVVREQYLLNPLKKTLRNIEREFEKTVLQDATDDAYLFFENFSDVFRAVYRISNIEIPYRDFDNIPVEIAIDVIDSDNSSSNDVIRIARTNIIESLKSELPRWFKNYYKKEQGTSVNKTYIVISERVYKELDFLDKSICTNVLIEGHNFYSAYPKKLIDHGKLCEFLQCIGLGNSKSYERIDGLFVPPDEYKKINDTLKKNKVVFVTGVREYGKTYTAIRLLWDYYELERYFPVYISFADLEKLSSVKKLKMIMEKIMPNHIIYVEDPFGKSSYRPNPELERSIANLIRNIEDTESCFLVVTSREEFFQKFNSSLIASVNLNEHEVNLTMNPYNYEKRKQMLLSWAKYFNCIWLSHNDITNRILEELKDSRKLPTPLNIKDFCFHSKDVNTLERLKGVMNQRSVETERGFAKDIVNESKENQLFLSLIVICQWLPIDIAKSKYTQLVLSTRVCNAWEFERILQWFSSKINIIKQFDDKKIIAFSHPSYPKALDHLLVEDGYPSTFNRRIFSKVLEFLSKDCQTIDRVIQIIASNYVNLPNNIKGILEKTVGTRRARKMILSSLLTDNKPSQKLFNQHDYPILTCEDLFFVNLIMAEQYNLSSVTSLISENFRWNELMRILKEEEKETLENFTELAFLKISKSPELCKLKNPFYKKLARRILEEKLVLLFLDKPARTYSELLALLRSDISLVKNIALLSPNISLEHVLRLILRHFVKKRYVIAHKDDIYQAKQALYLNQIGEDEPSESIEDPGFFNKDRVCKYISKICSHIRNGEQIRYEATNIVTVLAKSPSLIGLEPLRISSVIVNMACELHGSNCVKEIHNYTGVNKSYIYQKTKEFQKIYRKLVEQRKDR